MIPPDDDTRSDAELLERLSALPRHEATSPTFTNRVLLDLERRGLVHRAATRVTARWLAAATIVFAAGIGVGAAVVSARRPSLSAPEPPSRPTAERVTEEVNVPRVGQSEVWF